MARSNPDQVFSRSFFERSPALVAPELLGWVLSHGEVSLKVVETEAYLAREDAASHAYPGLTARNKSMFGLPGHSYIYRSYGMHLCFNVVCHETDGAGAVLIRAGEVIAGAEMAAQRRGRSTDLANGPGRLGQALALSLDLDGICLLSGPIRLQPGDGAAHAIHSGPRVGISKAVDLPLRFWIAGSPHVSKGRPGPAAAKKNRPS